MEPTTPNYVWTDDCTAWLTETLLRLNWSYRDLDETLGYGLSRGSYTRQVCKAGRVPSVEYQRRLRQWWANKPLPRPPVNLLHQIRVVAVPWLRARESHQPPARSYTRRQARIIAKRRLGRGRKNSSTHSGD